jgi:ubiquitin
MMERLVRESESWEDATYPKQIKHDETQPPVETEQKPTEAACISVSDDETVEEKAYKDSVSRTYEVYEKCRMEMKQRLESLGGDSGKILMRNWK